MKQFETITVKEYYDGNIYVYSLKTGKDEYTYEDTCFYDVINDLNEKGYRLICIKNEDTSDSTAYMEREIQGNVSIQPSLPTKHKETQFNINGIDLNIIEDSDKITFKPNIKGLEEYSFSFNNSVSNGQFIEKLSNVVKGVKKLVE